MGLRLSFMQFLGKYRRILREGAWVAASLVISAVALLLGSRLITRLVDPEVFGAANLLVGWVMLAKNVFAAPVMQAQLQHYPEYAHKGEVWRLRRVTNSMLMWVSVPLVAATLIGTAIYSYLAGESQMLGALLAAMLGLEIARSMEITYLGISRRQRALAVVQMAEALIRPACIIGLVLLLFPRTRSVMHGYVVCGLLSWIPLRYVFHREGTEALEPRGPADKELAQQMLSFALPLAPLAIVQWVVSIGPRYIVGAYFTKGDVGVYAAGFGLISQPFIMTQTLVARTLQGVHLKAIATGDKSTERKAFAVWLGVVSAVSLAGFLATLLLRHLVSRWFLGSEYQAAAEYMPWFAGGYALWAVAGAFEWRIYARKRTRSVLVVNALTAIAAVAAPMLLIPSYGALGVAMACPVYFGVMAVFMAGANLFHGRRTA